jgi:glycine/D-amino acid oxidase-like deaminating enzyme
MAEFPKQAKVVIIGVGGIVGASIAHHLIERGWDDIVGIDKSGVPTDIGSTAHASDFCYTTSHDYLSVWTTQYSIDFFEKMGHYARLAASRSSVPATRPGWKRSSARFPPARLSERGPALSVRKR